MSQIAAKIAFVIGNLDVGGAERHLVQVLPRLKEHNYEIAVFTLTSKGKLAPELERTGVTVIEPFFASNLRKFPSLLRRPFLLISAMLSYIVFLLRWRPKIVHFFLPAAYLLSGIVSLGFGERILVMSRRSLNHYQSKHPFLSKLERALHRHMNAVLGNSAAVMSNLRDEGVTERCLGLIYNGIDISGLQSVSSRSSVRMELGIRDHAFLMVCVANLIPYKGHVDLIEALGLVKQSLPGDWAIAMVGRDTGIGQELKKLAIERGIAENVHWLGERSDVIAIYSASDIGILCSHEEGFSNSVLEGMYANLAMIVTDVGGNAEAAPNGLCGIVVPPKQPAALAHAILKLATNAELRTQMGTLGSQRVKQEFTVDKCALSYSRLYEALLMNPHCHVQAAIDCASQVKGITDVRFCRNISG